ncbi:MAG: hypothetical protein AB1716_09505 [Planctomycetota bacterium]
MPFLILARFRAAQIRNALDQQLTTAPLRAFLVLVLLVLIWVALYWVFELVLRQVGRYDLVALVARLQIFTHLFLVLGVMLAFSNAILSFGSLFGRHEAGHLLALPAPPRAVVALKWLEGLFLSSWSFLLLGVPLMLAVAGTTTVAWYYYPLFIGHFAGFVIIPATAGLLAAWLVALWAPRRPLAVAAWCAGLVVVLGGLWLWNIFRAANISDAWLHQFYTQIRIARQPLLPSTWTSKGVAAAIEQRAASSFFYLLVVAANSAFFAWLTINLVSRGWQKAYSRAGQGRVHARIPEGWATDALCAFFFPYLRGRLKALMLKDLRGFARDPAQWTQMVILLGLLVVYALNLKRLPLDFDAPGMRGVVAFLNLTTVSLILATFTSRFVFPLLSAESQQLWLLGLLPAPRARVLLVKFIFSLTVTGLSALVVMGLAVHALELPAPAARLHLAVCLGICIGLSGLAVGLGARFPVLGERNPARIASGFGGTINLIASMLFVAVEIAGLASAGLVRVRQQLDMTEVDAAPWVLPALVLFGVAVAALSLLVGMRHFERLEY